MSGKNGKANILVAETKGEYCTGLLAVLAFSEEFNTIAVSSTSEFIEKVTSEHVDIALIEASMPDLNGWETIRKIRANGIYTPIILLLDQLTESDFVLGFESGADRVAAKSFNHASIIKIMHSIRSNFIFPRKLWKVNIKVGPHVFQPDSKLWVKETGEKFPLTQKEVDILLLLYKSGKTVSQDQFLQRIWGHNPGINPNTLNVHICNIRKKIEDDTEKPILLVRAGDGYMLNF